MAIIGDTLITRQGCLPDLSTIPVFEGVSAESLSLVTDDCVRHFYTSDEIVREGDEGVDLIVILRGRVSVSSGGTHIVSRGAGEIIGEQATIEGKPRSATVVAEGMVTALILPHRIMQRLLQDAVFVRNIAKVLSIKLREATAERAVRYRNEELLFSEFRAHVAPEVASRLLTTGISYGNPRFIGAAILMADVRFFSQKCARMDPQQIGEELSRYLDAMVDVIHKHRGFVDKFIGDAILAVWGVTPDDGNLAAQALSCAREMVKVAATLPFGGESIQIGVGLSQGQVFIGNVGGKGKRQFTVLGSPVNLAARYESESKTLRANIVAGQTFYEALPAEFRKDWQSLESRAIKGFGELSVYSWSAERGAHVSVQANGGTL